MPESCFIMTLTPFSAHSITPIAHIESDFHTKFGIPRQSGVISKLKARIVFEPQYRVIEAFRGLEQFSHIWLLWNFSEAKRTEWSPTVRPPRLGGNKRMGVFATRSPFRPNAIGLSSVRLLQIEQHPQLGPVLHIEGADLLNGTPIYDIKPYLTYTDSHPDATGGFTSELDATQSPLHVFIPEHLEKAMPDDKLDTLREILAADPRPHYQNDPGRMYGIAFAGHEIKFTISSDNILTVTDITRL